MLVVTNILLLLVAIATSDSQRRYYYTGYQLAEIHSPWMMDGRVFIPRQFFPQIISSKAHTFIIYNIQFRRKKKKKKKKKKKSNHQQQQHHDASCDRILRERTELAQYCYELREKKKKRSHLEQLVWKRVTSSVDQIKMQIEYSKSHSSIVIMVWG